MGMNIIKSSFKDISFTNYLVMNFDFFRLKKEINELNVKLEDKVSQYFEIISGYAFSSNDYEDEGIKVIRIGDISLNNGILYNEMLMLPIEYQEDYKKYLLQENDIVIGMTGDGKIFKTGFIDNLDEPILLNQRVGILRAKDNNYNKKFFYYLTKLDLFQNQIKIVSMGKTQKNVSPFDLLKIQIPNISLNIQNEIVKKIEPIEQEIQNLKTQKKEHLEIINEVFADEYQYSKTLWKEFGKGMTAGTQKSNNRNFRTYTMAFSQIMQSNIFRFSSRFHNPITIELENILSGKKTIKLKAILEQEIKRGISPKYDENGDILVIKTGQLKNSYIDLTDCEFVNGDFFNLKEKSQIKINDILIASTGKVSLGKIDINEEELDLIADGHLSIIRLNNQYSPLFLTYFLRSILGAYQIERDYTGATNQIELYANEIKNFDIPDFTLEKQQQIVEKIKSQIDTQKFIDEQIEQKQKEISNLIYQCVQGS